MIVGTQRVKPESEYTYTSTQLQKPMHVKFSSSSSERMRGWETGVPGTDYTANPSLEDKRCRKNPRVDQAE